jgi:hypothetical protein
MNSEEYQKLVFEMAKDAVLKENKLYHKNVAKIVIKNPFAVLDNSLREPSEEELLEVVEQHNPFAVENLTEDLRLRYTAICKLQLDVRDAILAYQKERPNPFLYRILEIPKSHYLTWDEVDPHCFESEETADFFSSEEAKMYAESYAAAMASIRIFVKTKIVAFNRYNEELVYTDP